MKEKTKLKVIQILCIISLIITVFSIQKTYARYFEKVDTTYATNIKRWVIKVKDTKIHQLKKDELSQVMQPVFIENEHMNSNNTLAPGREGYFPFEIDYGTVDLSFRFNFDIEQLNEITVPDETTGETITKKNPLEDFEVYGFEIIDGANTKQIETKDLEKINPIINIDPVNGDTITYTKIVTATAEELENLKVLQELEEFEDGSKKVEIKVTDALDTDKKVEIRVLFRWNDENVDVDGENEKDTQYTGTYTNLDYNVKVTFTQQL